MYNPKLTIPQPIITLAARSSSGQTNSYDFGDASECLVLVNVTAVSGVNPTLDITVQVSYDNSTWHDHTDLRQIIKAGNYPESITEFGKYVRLSYVIAGTNPSFTFQIKTLRK